jgi:hypothetical protein
MTVFLVRASTPILSSPSLFPREHFSLLLLLRKYYLSSLLNIHLVLGQCRSEISRLFSITESQTDQCFSSSLFVRHTNDKVSRRIQDRLDVVFQFVGFVDNVNGAKSKEFGSLLSVDRVGKDQQQYIPTTFDTERNTLQWFGQWPSFGSVREHMMERNKREDEKKQEVRGKVDQPFVGIFH